MADHEYGSEAWARDIQPPHVSHPSKTPHYRDRCCASVWTRGGWRSSQCGNKPKIWHGELGYCKTHAPETLLKRREASAAKVRADLAAIKARADKQRRESDFRTECVEAIKMIAAGHNDPRWMAQGILDRKAQADGEAS